MSENGYLCSQQMHCVYLVTQQTGKEHAIIHKLIILKRIVNEILKETMINSMKNLRPHLRIF